MSVLIVLSLLFAMLLSASAETWSIVSVNTHFMGSNSGLPGGTWPPGSEVPTTIDFTLQRFPDNSQTASSSTICACNYTGPDYPTNWMHCDDGTTAWRLRTKSGRTATNLTIELLAPAVVRQATSTQTTRTSISFATVQMSANDLNNPTAFLTCMGGAPLTGIRCGFEVNNIKLGKGGPIPLTFGTGYAEPLPFLVGNLSAQSSTRIIQPGNCVDTVDFNLLRTINGNSIGYSCGKTWTCFPDNFHENGIPPSEDKPFNCEGPLAYSWWTDPSLGGNVAENFTLSLTTTFCQTTFFRSLDGAALSFSARITGAISLRDGEELFGKCEDLKCNFAASEGKTFEIPVSGYEVVADGGC